MTNRNELRVTTHGVDLPEAMVDDLYEAMQAAEDRMARNKRWRQIALAAAAFAVFLYDPAHGKGAGGHMGMMGHGHEHCCFGGGGVGPAEIQHGVYDPSMAPRVQPDQPHDDAGWTWEPDAHGVLQHVYRGEH